VAEVITAPVRVPVPGGKSIDEYVGRVVNGETSVSIAHMKAPAGWQEPFQSPDFDEFTVVLSGALEIDTPEGAIEVEAGQAVITRAGERIRYRTPEGAEYIAICLPAFAPEAAHREGE
jgi:mannose-6-phosphate isomerase-like protein (cupin superfamily)